MNDALPTPTSALAYDQFQSASEGVVTAVADATNTSPLELEPLARTLDPDALDKFVDRLSDGPEESVAFAYCGYDVTVSGDGSVDLAEQSS
ncbi:HalOD1 output domain-containing protein [Halosimplex sp. J119]